MTAVENNLAMLERLRAKGFDANAVTVVKASVEHLETLRDETFDAAVMVNVPYAVDDPLACFQAVYRILKPGGMLGLSTTHAAVRLDPLLERIKNHLKGTNRFNDLADDYQRVHEVNKDIEVKIALRHTHDEYCQWLVTAGFEITKDVPLTYEGAVMLVHARKRT